MVEGYLDPRTLIRELAMNLVGMALGAREAGLGPLDITMSVGTLCLVMAVPAILSALIFNRARRVEPGR